MPTLHWIGKDKVINHHMDVPFKVLEHAYGFENGKQSDQETHSGNKIIHGDNLEALKALLPEYEGRIKCIYIDPPYNTGNESWVYNDNVNDPKIKKWLRQIVGSDDLAKHDKWLCMMYPRLRLLEKLLSKDGVLLISIGDDELQNLILLCNEIFGEKGHDATFVWKSRTKPTNAGRAKYRPQKVTEYVLLYTKSKELLFNTLTGEDNYSYPNEDKDGKFRTTTILTSNLGSYRRDTMRFEIADYTPPPEQRWKAGKEIIQGLYDNNRLQFKENVPMQKVYDFDNDEINNPLYTIIKQELSGTAESGKSLLNKIIGKGHGFDTVKPIELLTYLLKVFTYNDSIILDSFAGSGTTCHAVFNLNIADSGNRKFILIEMEDYAETITSERVKRVIKGYGETEGTKGSFDFYELGQPMFIEDGILNESVGIEKIRAYVWYTETQKALIERKHKDNKHFLGKYNDTAYYFNYEQNEITTLDHAFLSTMKTKAEQYVIYADNCLLTKNFMTKHHIIFKKIPRDITRF
ncbi:MAG: site-specific DNA-methyltransferase [Ignavibacteriaceae bacterium]|nr:site-specific DNA-methyltransferase [Ignavibacteriaceae bacterium]